VSAITLPATIPQQPGPGKPESANSQLAVPAIVAPQAADRRRPPSIRLIP